MTLKPYYDNTPENQMSENNVVIIKFIVDYFG